MKIIDINGKEREISSIKKITHQVPDTKTGELVDEDYIEVNIVGNVREWIEWYPLKMFNKYNPTLEV